MKLLHVVGARPNFMKAAPVVREAARRGVRQILVHTGQHYDEKMSDVFFRRLELPAPDHHLGVGSGSHAVQTAEVMMRIEPVLLAEKPDWVIVYGDVNSTMAATLTACKLRLRVAHVEAGLRSFDREMPEELNRLVTDQLADRLFTPSPDADAHLLREGIPADRIVRVGNVMIDTLVSFLPQIEAAGRSGLPDRYVLVTLHRPGNVDDAGALSRIVTVLDSIANRLPVVFPVHPRTRQRLSAAGLSFAGDVRLCDPMDYLDFLRAQRFATLVVTDSGGVQEETTFLGVPCLTLRPNTERPITLEIGTNTLVGSDPEALPIAVENVLRGNGRPGASIPLWDGRAAERIVASLLV